MNPLLHDMPLFVAVSRRKSFTLAAEALGLGISTLSRRIRELEKAMGVPLFLRNTRKVELTTSGRILLERCEFILAETDSAWESVVGNMGDPSGRVRVAMPEYAYHGMLKGVLNAFAAKWPGISLSVDFLERPVDLFSEPYDLAIRPGPLPDSSLIARKLFTVEPALYASPALLRAYPEPRRPGDLRDLPCILFTRMGDTWILHRDGNKEVVHPSPTYVFNSITLCHEFAVSGLGVAMLRKPLAAPDEASGALKRILPDWSGSRFEACLLMPPGQAPQRVRVFVDYLVAYFSGKIL